MKAVNRSHLHGPMGSDVVLMGKVNHGIIGLMSDKLVAATEDTPITPGVPLLTKIRLPLDNH